MPVDRARRGADAPLELVADHARASADVALVDFDRCRRQCGLDVDRRHALRLDVVEKPVVGLADDRQRPGVVVGGARCDRVADDADAEGVGDSDRRGQQA